MAKTTNIGLNLLFVGKIKHIIQLYKTPKTFYSPNQTILNVDFEQQNLNTDNTQCRQHKS